MFARQRRSFYSRQWLTHFVEEKREKPEGITLINGWLTLLGLGIGLGPRTEDIGLGSGLLLIKIAFVIRQCAERASTLITHNPVVSYTGCVTPFSRVSGTQAILICWNTIYVELVWGR